MLIHQNNLTIRNAAAVDASLLGSWWRDGKVMAHAGFPNGISITDKEVAVQLSSDTDETHRRLIIEADNVPIGEMNYRNKRNGIAEIGIKICDIEKQEKGYGTQLLRMLIGVLFNESGYEKIILDTNLSNLRAQHVYEKIGFRKKCVNIDSWKNQLGELQSSVEYEITKADYLNECKNHWYAYIYEQQITQADEVGFIIDIIGKKSQNVLEVACGGGRILAQLAKAGHTATGFDCDRYMLDRCKLKIQSLNNASCYYRDAISENWGSDFDVVVLAGNILLNIVSDMDYSTAQQLFIKKAAAALKYGGYIYLDFDCFERPDQTYDNKQEWVCFEGTDDLGTYGKYIVISGDYSSQTHIDNSTRRYEITPIGGETVIFEINVVKHFPALEQVHLWLTEAGFIIEQEYGGYDREPIGETTNRAIIYARKGNRECPAFYFEKAY